MDAPGHPPSPRTKALLARCTGFQRSMGRFLSNEEASLRFRDEVREIKRRAKTSTLAAGYSQYLHDQVVPRVYGEQTFKRLVLDIGQYQLQTERMALRFYDWLVPGDATSPQQLADFDAFMHRAMTVPNKTLGTFMKIERSTAASPPTKLGHHFYFRSWIFELPQLEELIEYCRQDESVHKEMEEWQKLIDLWRAKHNWCVETGETPPTFTVRYWGTTEGPRRPIDRHMADLKNRNSGILDEFLSTVESRFPDVSANAEVYLLPDAWIAPGSGSQLFADDTECLLIQFGHYPTNLNRQRGGMYSSFLPNSGDADRFRAMKTDFWNDFRAMASLTPDKMSAELDSHFAEVHQYANDHPAESGTCKHYFTDNMRMTAQRQATPYQYKGHTVLVHTGKDITYMDYLSEVTFIDGSSRAGVLYRDIVARTIGFEAAANNREIRPQAFNAQMSPWCFVDLWPWLWHKNMEQAIAMLRAYFSIVRPLVAVSFGQIVSGVTRSDFQHENGLPMTGFTSHVGDVSIQFYDNREQSEETAERDPMAIMGFTADDEARSRHDCAFINIVHMHPGRDKYGVQDVRLRRVLELSVQLAFLVSHFAIETLDRYDEDEMPSRLALCEEIIAHLEQLKVQQPYKEFFAELSEAKTALLAHLRDRSGHRSSLKGTTSGFQASPEDIRPLINQAGSLKLKSLGQAEGKEESDTRLAQLESLWDMNMPDLHLVHAHNEANKKAWMKALRKLAPGQFYYLAILAQLPPDDYVKHILSGFRPRDIKGSSLDWLENDLDRSRGAIRAGLWIRDNARSGRRPRRAHPQPFLPISEQNGRPIGIVASSGLALIRVLTAEGRHQTFRISCKPAIPTDEFDTRSLVYHEHGIDVRSGSGKLFRSQISGGRMAEASVPWRSFQNDLPLLQHWKDVCQYLGINLPAAATTAVATKVWPRKGKDPLSSQAKDLARFPQNRPVPAEGDANFILYKFLEEFFPDGGTFHSIGTEDKPDSPAHLDAFRAFLSRPYWIGHPFLAWWKSKIDVERPQMAALAKNIPVYRDCTKFATTIESVTRKGPKGQRLVVQDSQYFIGAPGSAMDDPFEKGSQQACVPGNYKPKRAGADGEEAEDDTETPQPKSKSKRKSDSTTAPVEQKPTGKKSRGSNKRKAEGLDDDDSRQAQDDDSMLLEAPAQQQKKVPKKRKKTAKNDEEQDFVLATMGSGPGMQAAGTSMDVDTPQQTKPRLSKAMKEKAKQQAEQE